MPDTGNLPDAGPMVDAGPPGDGAAHISCIAAATCANACEGDAGACRADCASMTCSEGQAALVALGECAETNGCTDEACVATNCLDEFTACGAATCGGA